MKLCLQLLTSHSTLTSSSILFNHSLFVGAIKTQSLTPFMRPEGVHRKRSKIRIHRNQRQKQSLRLSSTATDLNSDQLKGLL